MQRMERPVVATQLPKQLWFVPTSVDLDTAALPSIQGKYALNFPLAPLTWLQVGGPADIYVRPHNLQDLVFFLRNRPPLPVYILGAGSNILIRDNGVRGIVIKLMGQAFIKYHFEDNNLIVGAGALDRTIAFACAHEGLSGLEFLISIPGSIGGAIAMNAGAYNQEVSDHLVWIEGVTHDGQFFRLTRKQLLMTYRHGGLPEDFIVTQGCFALSPQSPAIIQRRLDDILLMRAASQPTKGKTGGSTFKNTLSHRAWELIDQAGCRGLENGHAQISIKHCNFLINRGGASSQDIEELGMHVQKKVAEKTGVQLEWEIIRLGDGKSFMKSM